MDTFFDERIERVVYEQQEIERLGSYKPRSGGIGRSLSKYSPELFAKLKADVELRNIMDALGYEGLLDLPPEEWSSLKMLDKGAREYLPTWHNTQNRKIVILNKTPLARTKNEVTQWQKIKMDLGIVDKNCDCEKCRAMKARNDGSSKEAEKEKARAEGTTEEEKNEEKKAEEIAAE